MRKLQVAILSLFLVGILSFSLVNAQELGYNNPNLPRIEAPTPPVITFANNSGSVNKSIFTEIWITDEGDMDNVPDLFPTLDGEYVCRDGTCSLTADWDAGAFTITQKTIKLTDKIDFLVVDSDGITPITFTIAGLIAFPSTISITGQTSTLATLELIETISGAKTFIDNVKQIFGSNDKVSFFHDGTDFFLDLQESASAGIFKIINGQLQLNEWCGVIDANTCWQLSDTGNDEAKLKVGGDEAIFCDEVGGGNIDTCNWGAEFEQNNIGSPDAGSNITILNNMIVNGNATGENLYISRFIFSHTNETIPLISANVWENVTFSQEVADLKFGIEHSHDTTSHVFNITTDGIYDIDYDFDIEDTSPSASDIDVAGRLTWINGSEVPGSVFETDITKQGAEIELSHEFLARLNAGDQVVFQFIADDEDVQISTHGSFGIHPESATVIIKKVANIL